ncbi:PH domain-containing protein [Paraburkholderia terricola]|uniref:Membrane protein YdbS with pleckstrin-like domain n=1 Tax=Paraburkholderia terricola TaxID=169427 RepID=A0ABU1M0A3_9BURK|nr:PH domain-containing protein [Paraburkholderia terricola]MDR6412286.1 membrane protein YdbS with pleckstrin-like domain [Paraburkholderia terricola]MDR6484651.1 membrane protein YdbS with pleckstrin-like domain [Paraburkholderia terricola]
MNQPVPIVRNAHLELVQGVIFNGTPSQVINLPDFIKGFVAAVIVIASYLYAMTHWPVPWFVPVLALLLIGVGVVVAYLRTAFTEIVIDTARITLRQGILSRRVQSIELFRIQDVTSLHPWWQRLFGIGTVIVLTSDSNNPHWRLPGMRGAEQLRDDLNRAAIALRDAKGIREVNMGRV